MSYGLAPTSMNSMIGPYASVLDYFGAKNTARIILKNEWWRLWSPMLLHGGLIHLVFNVMMQIRIGLILEYNWGIGVFIVVYLVSGTVATLLSCCCIPDTLSVGSSGALMGLMGAWLLEITLKWRTLSEEELKMHGSYLIMIGINVAITLSFSMVPYVDWAAHLGGFIGGALLGGALFGGSVEPAWQGKLGQCICLVVLLVSLGVGIWILYDVLEPNEELLHVCKYYEEAFGSKAGC